MRILLAAGLFILLLFAVLYIVAQRHMKRTANQHPENAGDRKVAEAEYVFLTEKKAIWAGMLADVLTQKKIAFITKNVLGAGITVKIGYTAEIVKFYVRRDCYEKARELEKELFSVRQDDVGQGEADNEEA